MTVQLDWIPRADDFASRLVLIRHEMGWNLKEAAIACGIRAQSWREWELKHRKPQDYEAVCQKIAQRSGCNLVWLMTGYEPPSPDGGGSESPLPGSNRGQLAYFVRPLRAVTPPASDVAPQRHRAA